MQNNNKSNSWNGVKAIEKKDLVILNKLEDAKKEEFNTLLREYVNTTHWKRLVDLDKPLTEQSKEERKLIAKLFGEVAHKAMRMPCAIKWHKTLREYAYEDVVAYTTKVIKQNKSKLVE